MTQLAVQPSPREQAGRTADETPATPGSSPAKARCTATGVTKAFGAQPILRGVDLEIAEGAFAVLVGPSGCGKSTLLRLIAGLEQPDQGTIRLAGRDVTQLPPRDRDVAMVFQSYALYPHLTVRDNLAFGLKLRGAPPAEIDSRIKEASAMLSLDALTSLAIPKQLSGGQRQRVAMGRAIVRRPTLFLFDEPLSNLDAALRAEVRVEIRRLHDRLKATTLYVTHDQVEAMTLADTLWVMNGGQVEQSGKPLDIYERPRTKFVAGFLGSPQVNFLDATVIKENPDGHRGRPRKGRGSAVPRRRRRASARSLAAGSTKVTVVVRPHDFQLAREGREEAACRDDTASRSWRPSAPRRSRTGGSPRADRMRHSAARRRATSRRERSARLGVALRAHRGPGARAPGVRRGDTGVTLATSSTRRLADALRRWRSAHEPSALAVALFALISLIAKPALADEHLVLWHSYRGDEERALAGVVRTFEERHPGVTVEVLAIPFEAYAAKLTAAVPRAHGPDLFIQAHQWIGPYLDERLVAPIGDGLSRRGRRRLRRHRDARRHLERRPLRRAAREQVRRALREQRPRPHHAAPRSRSSLRSKFATLPPGRLPARVQRRQRLLPRAFSPRVRRSARRCGSARRPLRVRR